MSWLLLNTVLAVQVLIVWIVGVNIQRMARTTSKVREWAAPFPEAVADIREEIIFLTRDIDIALVPMARHFPYIFIPASLAVGTNIIGDNIVWVPFWASIGFTVGSLYHLFQIALMGSFLNEQTVEAETEIKIRMMTDDKTRNAWFEDILAEIHEGEQQHNEENS